MLVSIGREPVPFNWKRKACNKLVCVSTPKINRKNKPYKLRKQILRYLFVLLARIFHKSPICTLDFPNVSPLPSQEVNIQKFPLQDENVLKFQIVDQNNSEQLQLTHVT